MVYQTDIIVDGEHCTLTIDAEAFKNDREPNQVINEAISWIAKIWNDEEEWHAIV